MLCYVRFVETMSHHELLFVMDFFFQVFSMLDTKYLVRASACCTMFKKCAMDPLCYSHIELPGNAGNKNVRRMILNAGKELR